MEKKELEKLYCGPNISIKEAMELLSKVKGQILLVVDENKKLLGVITDGDLRRALLRDLSLSTEVSNVMNKEPKKVLSSNKKEVAKYMKKFSVKQVPVVDKYERIKDIILWDDVINGSDKELKLDNVVFVLAGGRGVRLEPFTKILPKPLIPIGEKPIIEIVMDNCRKHGLYNFIISINYKSSIIKYYFAENQHDSVVNFVEEDKPLGTAGSLFLIKNHIKDAFVVTNCDVLIDIDYSDILRFHKENKYHITIVGVIKEFKIPYGVIEMNQGKLTRILEKPGYDMVVNAGIYIMERDVLDLIPDNAYMDMPDLIMLSKDKGYDVGVYPYSGEWIDVGQWDEYKKAIAHVEMRLF